MLTRVIALLLCRLADLAEKESKLCKEINRIYSNIEWPGIYTGREGITLCEDTDDANIISLNQKIELKEVRDEIVNLLKRAVNEFEMGDVGIIQRQYNNYVGKGENK